MCNLVLSVQCVSELCNGVDDFNDDRCIGNVMPKTYGTAEHLALGASSAEGIAINFRCRHCLCDMSPIRQGLHRLVDLLA